MRKTIPLNLLKLVSFLILLICIGCGVSHKVSYLLTTNLTKDDPDSVARGSGIFIKNCAECHGADAKGGLSIPVVIPNLIEFAKEHSENEVAYKIATGDVYHMPDFDNYLTEREIWDVTNFLMSLK